MGKGERFFCVGWGGVGWGGINRVSRGKGEGFFVLGGGVGKVRLFVLGGV